MHHLEDLQPVLPQRRVQLSCAVDYCRCSRRVAQHLQQDAEPGQPRGAASAQQFASRHCLFTRRACMHVKRVLDLRTSTKSPIRLSTSTTTTEEHASLPVCACERAYKVSWASAGASQHRHCMHTHAHMRIQRAVRLLRSMRKKNRMDTQSRNKRTCGHILRIS